MRNTRGPIEHFKQLRKYSEIVMDATAEEQPPIQNEPVKADASENPPFHNEEFSEDVAVDFDAPEGDENFDFRFQSNRGGFR